MNRELLLAGFVVWGALVAASPASAAVHTIEGRNPMRWDPEETTASVGDVIEWKIRSGNHGLRITNWADVKDHVEVETVTGQHPFNETDGRSDDGTDDDGTSTVGQVLLRLKIKSAPPAAIAFDCTVHGPPMDGKVTVAAAN